MPTTEPRTLRRTHGGGGGDRPRPQDEPGRRPLTAPTESNGDHRAADEVYSFLSSFTAGVQRGLDEAHTDDRGKTKDEG